MNKQKIIVIARCKNIRGKNDSIACFGFVGVYNGVQIKSIEIANSRKFSFERGKEYILFVQLIEIASSTIICNAEKIKALWQ